MGLQERPHKLKRIDSDKEHREKLIKLRKLILNRMHKQTEDKFEEYLFVDEFVMQEVSVGDRN